MHGITNYSSGAAGLSFRWWSIRTIYATILIALSAVALSLSCYRVMSVGISLGGFTTIMFYFTTICTAVMMYRLAATGQWRRLMAQFEQVEAIFTQEEAYPTPTRWTLRRKIGVLTAVVVTTLIVEHTLYLLAKMTNVWSQIQKCNFKIFFYEHFLRTERRHLYAVIPFSYYVAIPFEITNMCNTAAWTFLDLFIMIYSIALAHRFNQISRRIRKVLLQPMPDDFWLEVREHFITLQELVEIVDDRLSYLILLSCGTDVYFTCFLLFNSFGDIPERLNALYFYFSMMFIITRTLSTLFFATSVHDAARRPHILLKSVPHHAWGPEVERFTYQLGCEMVALSGKKFFYFTRNVILTVWGQGRELGCKTWLTDILLCS